MGWVPEGQRSGQMSYSTSNRSATYMTIGEEDAATFEAISAGRTFEDIQAMMAFRLLQKMMLKEEMAMLGGNAGAGTGGVTLGVPATPTVSELANTSSTLPTGTYYVKVVGLTLRRLPELDRAYRRRDDEEHQRRRRQALHTVGRLVQHLCRERRTRP